MIGLAGQEEEDEDLESVDSNSKDCQEIDSELAENRATGVRENPAKRNKEKK